MNNRSSHQGLTIPSEQLKVDLGCGNRKPMGFTGVDCWPGKNVDIVADLTQGFPFSDNTVDVIRAHDFIEHLSDKMRTMSEIWRIGKPGALVDILVPSTDGRGAFQDPTHVSFWNINSFKYYCEGFDEYRSLGIRYGFQGCFRVQSLENIIFDDPEIVYVKADLIVVKSDSPVEVANEAIPGLTPQPGTNITLF